jgi:elongator complex protein 4
LVLPSLLSPNMYPPGCSQPTEVLQFLHAVRALLRQYSRQLTAMITLSESLFPRGSGLTRWIELLCDGVIELVPSAAVPGAAPARMDGKDGKDAKDADMGQGFTVIHTLPVFHEKGGGGAETTHSRENLTFSLSASKGIVFKPFSLPPLGETEKQESSPGPGKDSLEF